MVTDAPGNARPPGQQRALQGIGADVGSIELSAQLVCQIAPYPPLQPPMGERQFDDGRYLRHGAVDRDHPGQRADGDRFATGVQPTQQRFGHDRIPDPLGGDHQ